MSLLIRNINGLIKGFIKLIHPDLFANKSKEIRMANISGVKSLNEILDFVGGIEACLVNKTSLNITSPLPKYDNLCYFNPHMYSDSKHSNLNIKLEDDTIPARFILNPPIEFCTKQSIDNYSKVARLSTLLHYQLVGSYYHCNLSNHPLIIKDALNNEIYSKKLFLKTDKIITLEDDTDLNKDELKSFYSKAYDRWFQLELEEIKKQKISNMYKTQYLNKYPGILDLEDKEEDEIDLVERYTNSNKSKVFSSSQKKRKDQLLWRNNMEIDIDLFISNGNILIADDNHSSPIIANYTRPIIDHTQQATFAKKLSKRL